MKKTFKQSPFLSGTNSEPTPTAQTTGLCAPGYNHDPLLKVVLSSIERLQLEHNPLGYIVELLFLYGLRVSEVLSINCRYITVGGTVRIEGAKGSDNRIIVYPAIVELAGSSIGSDVLLFGCFNRWFVYRELKKLGIYMLFLDSEKKAVTHSLRYLKIKMMKSQGLSDEDIQSFIGHKSISNTKYYVEKQ